MKKTSSIMFGIVLMAVALLLFSSDNMWCACAGTACLFVALILIRYADSARYTQDEKRGKSNRNVKCDKL